LFDSKKVENKVIFGDFESDWFDQEFGLKQGCVLSPTLFSILMTDLANMLENSSIGANIGHLARLYQRPLIDPKKPNKEVFLKIYIGMQYPVKNKLSLC
jgi:hypothetical protein